MEKLKMVSDFDYDIKTEEYWGKPGTDSKTKHSILYKKVRANLEKKYDIDKYKDSKKDEIIEIINNNIDFVDEKSIKIDYDIDYNKLEENNKHILLRTIIETINNLGLNISGQPDVKNLNDIKLFFNRNKEQLLEKMGLTLKDYDEENLGNHHIGNSNKKKPNQGYFLFRFIVKKIIKDEKIAEDLINILWGEIYILKENYPKNKKTVISNIFPSYSSMGL